MPPKTVPIFEYGKTSGAPVKPADVPKGTPMVVSGGPASGTSMGTTGSGGSGIPKIGDAKPGGGQFHGGVLYKDSHGVSKLALHHHDPD